MVRWSEPAGPGEEVWNPCWHAGLVDLAPATRRRRARGRERWRFVEVVPAGVQETAAIAVVVAGDLRIEVGAGFDAEVLRSVVHVLRSC